VPASYANSSSHLLKTGPLAQDWSNTGLITVNNDWSQVPSIMGYLGDYSASLPVNVDPRTLLTMDNATASVVAQGSATASPGAVYELQNENPTIALHASGTADAPYLVFYLDTTGCMGVNIRYTLREMDNDNAPNMVAYGADLAKQHGFTNLEFRLGDLESPPIEDGSIDLALFSQALHHARQPGRALEAAYRMLKPGGRLVVLDLLKHWPRPGLQAGPEHAVMHQQQIGASSRSLAHDGQGGVHGGDDLGHLTAAILQLQAVERIRIVWDFGDPQFGFEVGDEVSDFHHDTAEHKAPSASVYGV
jgi:SAM-dependent methyltransferase